MFKVTRYLRLTRDFENQSFLVSAFGESPDDAEKILSEVVESYEDTGWTIEQNSLVCVQWFKDGVK